MVCVDGGVKCVGVCWEVVGVDRNDVQACWGPANGAESARASEREIQRKPYQVQEPLDDRRRRNSWSPSRCSRDRASETRREWRSVRLIGKREREREPSFF
jgi:hypothetical protein